jgi:hypothetical protein
MSGMTTHSKNTMKIRETLWYILQDAHFGDDPQDISLYRILNAISRATHKAGMNTERLNQLYDEVRPLIYNYPTCPRYSEDEWVSAYILHLNRNKFKPLYYKLYKIDREIMSLYETLYVLDTNSGDTEEEIAEIADITRKLLDRTHKLKCQRKNILSEVETLATQLLTR